MGTAWVQRVLSECEVRARRVQSWCGAAAGRVRRGCRAGAARHRHEVMPLELEPGEEVGDVVVLDEHVGVEEDGLLVWDAREQERLLEPALSCRRWSSGCARAGRPMRSALSQLRTARPQRNH